MKIIILIFFFLFFSLPGEIFASTATSVVETQVEGEGEVYQYVETTVDGQTISKESREPGKLELEMKKVGDSEPTVVFSQEPQETMTVTLTPTPTKTQNGGSFVSQIIEFVKKLLSNLTLWFK